MGDRASQGERGDIGINQKSGRKKARKKRWGKTGGGRAGG